MPTPPISRRSLGGNESKSYVSRICSVPQSSVSRSPIIFGVDSDVYHSPRGLADAAVSIKSPCGVYTRFHGTPSEHAFRFVLPTSSRNMGQRICGKFRCSICQKKAPCLCQSCTAHKVRFYEKKALQESLLRTKENLLREISEELKEQVHVEEQIQETRESVALIKLRIEEVNQRILEKRQSLTEMNSKITRHRKNNGDLSAWCGQHEKALSRVVYPKNEELEKVQKQLSGLQRMLAVQLFTRIFPIAKYERKCSQKSVIDESEKTRRIREQIAEAARTTSDDRSNWTMLVAPKNESVPHSNIRFSICGCFFNDDLREWLRVGLPKSRAARALHSALAAVTYAVQLVGILPVLFDVYLPYQLSLRDVALCDNWKEEGLFDTDIFKLNMSVLLLCLNRGIDAERLNLLEPFANLLILCNALINASPHHLNSTCVLSDELAQLVEKEFKKVTWAERERAQVAVLPTEDDWYFVVDDI